MSDKPPLPWYKLRWWVILLIFSPLLLITACDLLYWFMYLR
jgi:hypothetical protein